MKPKSLERIAEKAYNNGTKHSLTKGRLNKYITSVWYKDKTANNIRIYGENIYLFCGDTLVTLYRVPNHLIKYL